MSRAGAGFERLQSVLTEEQRASLREAMQAQREKLRDLEEQIRDQRQQLMLAGLTEKFDEEAVRKKALAVAKVEAEMTVLRAKAFSQIRPALTAEQMAKLKAGPAGPGSDQPETPRRRPDVPRDEHGLPLKDSPPATKPPQ
jgi:Spy/CpxP family protein refolding chaperone